VRETRRALAETLSRIGSLLGDGRSPGDVLDTEKLSIDTGVPKDLIKALLDGEEPPEEDVTDRIIRRFDHLRETRLRPDGTRHSYEEIAAAFGASRASLSNLVNSRKKTPPEHGAEQRPGRSGGPLASTQAGIEKFFFGQPNGWLSAEPESVLNDALQPVLATLRSAAGADSDSYSEPRVVALRTAATLPDDKWALVVGFIETLERQVREERRQER
jgi:hypothetical protein